MPEGGLMGSGEDTSEVPPPPLVSICSTPNTSTGCSTELPGESVEGLPDSSGPRSQESPPENFNGLRKKMEKAASSFQNIS